MAKKNKKLKTEVTQLQDKILRLERKIGSMGIPLTMFAEDAFEELLTVMLAEVRGTDAWKYRDWWRTKVSKHSQELHLLICSEITHPGWVRRPYLRLPEDEMIEKYGPRPE